MNRDEGLPSDTGPDEEADQPAEPTPSRPGKHGADDSRPNSHVRDAGSAADLVDAGPPVALDAGPPIPPIEVPRSNVATLMSAWEQRRAALASHDLKGQKEAEAQLIRQRDELAIHDLSTIASALDFEARKKIESKDPGEALRLAQLAVQLAPDGPSAYLELARIEFGANTFDVANIFKSMQDAVLRSFEQRQYLRAFLGNLLAAVLFGLGLASILGLLVICLPKLRYAFHDFHHLFPTGALPAQTATLFGLMLAAPYVFHLGGFAELALVALATFLYLGMAERVVVSVLLMLLAFLPIGAGQVAGQAMYEGSRAADLFRVEAGGPDAAGALSRLNQIEGSGKADFPVLFALAQDAKRQGDFLRANVLYRRAVALNPTSAEAANNLGNVAFLLGQKENARDAYLKATDLRPDEAVYWYNLYRASVRWAQSAQSSKETSDDIERGKNSSANVIRLDRTWMERPLADLRSNYVVVDAQLPSALAAATSEGGSLRDAVSSQLRSPLMGLLPEEVSLALAAGGVALLWLVSLGQRRLRPCTECAKCGRPVCGRCDKDVTGGTLCGQCLTVFARKGAVDPPARLRKEQAVKQYQERWSLARRALSMLMAGGGHLASGRPVQGILFLGLMFILIAAVALGEGIFRAPFGTGLGTFRQVVAVILLVGVWAISWRSYRSLDGRR